MKTYIFSVLAMTTVWTGMAALAADKAAPQPGAQVAQAQCARCHDIRTGKVTEGGPGIPPSFQAIADNPDMSADKMRQTVRLPHGKMDNVLLTQAEIGEVINYIQSLKSNGSAQ
jgi:mono/diheme cytochrome c family protein